MHTLILLLALPVWHWGEKRKNSIGFSLMTSQETGKRIDSTASGYIEIKATSNIVLIPSDNYTQISKGNSIMVVDADSGDY